MAGTNILGQAIEYLILDSQSITTIIFLQLPLLGRLIITLIEISFYFQFRTSSSFKRPLYILCKALACQQVQQLIMYLYTILYMFSQQYSHQSSFRVFLWLRQLATNKLYTYLRSLSLNLLQYLFYYQLMVSKH